MRKEEKRGDYARNMYTDWALPSTTKEKDFFLQCGWKRF